MKQKLEGHRAGGDRLVAPHEDDEGVEHVAPSDEFDRVGNDFTGDEGGLHPFGTHGHTIADRNRVQFHGSTTGLANAFLDLLGEAAQAPVAGHRFDPGVGDPDDWPTEVVV